MNTTKSLPRDVLQNSVWVWAHLTFVIFLNALLYAALQSVIESSVVNAYLVSITSFLGIFIPFIFNDKPSQARNRVFALLTSPMLKVSLFIIIALIIRVAIIQAEVPYQVLEVAIAFLSVGVIVLLWYWLTNRLRERWIVELHHLKDDIVNTIKGSQGEVGKRLELLTLANKDKLGLVIVYQSLEEIRELVYYGIRRSKDVKALGGALSLILQAPDIKNILAQRLHTEKDFHCRLLYFAPTDRVTNTEGLRSELRIMAELLHSLEGEQRKRLEVRVSNKFYDQSMLIVGEEMLIGGYSFMSNYLPMIKVKRGPIYDDYQRQFDTLWNTAEETIQEPSV